jgi:DNA-binding transcriptional LysR family regulator
MQVFKVVAETSSFTKAAQQLQMTQPAVTFQIKELEAELGMPVFNRVRNTIEITEAGKIALKCSKRVQDAYAKMREAIAVLSVKTGEKS